MSEAPSIVFFEDIDILTSEETDQHMRSEFFKQLDKTRSRSSMQDHVLFIGATSRPWDLTSATRRRFSKRLYISLPELDAREALLRNLLSKDKKSISDEEFVRLSHKTAGYSGADLKELCKDAALAPLDELGLGAVDVADIPPITYKHFCQVLRSSRRSVSQAELVPYEDWNNMYGWKKPPSIGDYDTDESD